MTSKFQLFVPVGTTVDIQQQQAPALVLNLDVTDAAAIAAAAGQSSITQAINIAQPWAFNPEFGVESTGMPYLRVSSDPDTTHPNRQRLIDFRFPIAPCEEAWTCYVLMPESDVVAGMTETGVKLPGIANTFTLSQPELCELRTEHGKSDPANPGALAFKSHWYIAETPASGTAIVGPIGGNLFAGQYACVEAHHKMNTPGVADGVMELWLNGALVHQRSNVLYRNNAATRFSWFYANIYHGGLGNPSAPIHYRLARVAVSVSGRVGVPANMPVVTPPVNPGPWPTWRNNKPVDVFFPVPMTSNMGGTTMNVGTVNAWSGYAAGPGRLASPLNGGHGDSGENKVIALDLTANAPAWQLWDAGSAPGAFDQAYYPDGRPASRHVYFSAHDVPQRGRVMTFTAAALYGTGSGNALTVDGFNIATKQWDAAGTYPNAPFVSTACSQAVDPRTGDVYIGCTGSRFAKWTQATGTWSILTPGTKHSFEFVGSCIDTLRNRWVTLNAVITSIDLANPTSFIDVAITGPAANAILHRDNYCAVVYDPDKDRYLTIQDAGTTLYAVKPDGTSSIVATGVPAPIGANGFVGVNGRLNYHAAVGGVTYHPTFASNILFLPTR